MPLDCKDLQRLFIVVAIAAERQDGRMGCSCMVQIINLASVALVRHFFKKWGLNNQNIGISLVMVDGLSCRVAMWIIRECDGSHEINP